MVTAFNSPSNIELHDRSYFARLQKQTYVIEVSVTKNKIGKPLINTVSELK
jgi:hypothetical protein